FRIESKYAGPLNWQAGMYYFDEDGQAGQDNYNVAGDRTSRVVSQQKNKAWAAFGSVNYNVTDAFTVRGGLRFTHDQKEFNTLEATNIVLVGPN
ncbi:TonB-dependent receptor, partial [Variovorax sp. 2RAF20]